MRSLPMSRLRSPIRGLPSSVLPSLVRLRFCRLQTFRGQTGVARLDYLEPSREELLSCDEEIFRLRLTQYFGGRLGRFCRSPARCLSLSLTLAREQIRPGLVLLGNVAHTLHPVAGQGLNLALRDSAALVRQLVSAKAQGVSPGEMKILQTYLELQNQDQSESVLFTDQTVKLFSNDQWAQERSANWGCWASSSCHLCAAGSLKALWAEALTGLSLAESLNFA